MPRTWAVIINTSAWYVNYRHSANGFYFRQLLHKWGIYDENVIHIQAQDNQCDSRNPQPGSLYMFNSNTEQEFLDHALVDHRAPLRVDYRATDVQIDTLTRILSGKRGPGWSPRSKVLSPRSEDRILVYITGHGGDHFIKLRDWKDWEAEDMAYSLDNLAAKDAYSKLLWLGDSCEISTLQDFFQVPSISIGSSVKDQSAWSSNYVNQLTNSTTDVWSREAARYFEAIDDPCVLPSEKESSEIQHSIESFFAITKAKSRSINMQDAEMRVIPGDESANRHDPKTDSILSFLSYCPSHQGLPVTMLSKTEALPQGSSWEIPPLVPNPLTSLKSGPRIGPEVKKFSSENIGLPPMLPGRFVSSSRLAKTNPLYNNFDIGATSHREQLVRYTDGVQPRLYPESYPMVMSDYSPPERQLKRNPFHASESSWTKVASLMDGIFKVGILSTIVVLFGVRAAG